MHEPASQASREYAEPIARALAVDGGHLLVGRGGATLFFENGWLSGCHPDRIKAASIAAGLPVIDGRTVPFEAVYDLAVFGPLVAVRRKPCPPPYHALSYAQLGV